MVGGPYGMVASRNARFENLSRWQTLPRYRSVYRTSVPRDYYGVGRRYGAYRN